MASIVCARSLRLLVRRSFLPSSELRSLHVETHKDHVRLIDNDQKMDFHYVWLRHNCPTVGVSVHPQTNERIVDCARIPLNIKPELVELVNNQQKLQVVWSKDHASVFDIPFLLTNAYGKNRIETEKPNAQLEQIQFTYDKESHACYLRKCYDRLKKFGLVVVKQRGLDTEAIIQDFLPSGASVVDSHFGRIEDLRTDNTTNKNTDQLGYTNAAIDLHTDQPFIADPPGMQLLQCMRRADTGGSNYFVDACHAALYLREIHPEAYYILTTVPVRFHRKQKLFESVHNGPIIEADGDKVHQVRHSYFTLAPFNFPFWLTMAFYKAYGELASILYDPKSQYRVQLDQGDFVLYDNHRMLHAREAFTGSRHLRGIYFRHTDVWRKLEQKKSDSR